MWLPILLLSFVATLMPLVDPIMGQEIVIKSMNLSPVGAGSGGAIAGSNVNSIQQQQQQHQHQQTKQQQQPLQNHQQQQQQQQQPQQQRQFQQRQPQQLHSQDPHLKSLTVFATNYDAIADNNESNNHNNKLSNFKPSYNYNSNNHYNSLNPNINSHKRLPIEFETNFTPIRLPHLAPSLTHTSLGSGVPLQQPVIMQYLPQTVQQSGVQYLQLIPTRPLIVPIGPYLAPGGAGTTPTASSMADLLTHNNHIYHQAPPPPASLTTNTITADYGMHSSSAPILGSVPAHSALAATPAAQLLEATPSVPYTYGQSLQPYRHYRFNREIKPRNLLSSMSLNLHEYLPSGHEPVHAAVGRGRL